MPHQGHVAAVTMYQTATSLNFYYTKHAPCNGALDIYIAAIHEAIKSNKILATIQCKIVWEALANCIEKFKSRIIKCKKAVEAYTETEEGIERARASQDSHQTGMTKSTSRS